MSGERPDVVIVGAGPAGLTAAAELAATHRVLVLEREGQAGGIPRHSDHLGYGMRDLRTVTTGPRYARRLLERALGAGAEIRTGAMVTGWSDDRTLEVTAATGRVRVSASAVVLATGARERPRTARLVPGDRPRGVLNTGQLQQLVHLQHCSPGTRAVVVGAELVSWSAVLTLREAGVRTVLMATEQPRAESYAAFSGPARLALRVPVATGTRVSRIIGRETVEAVEVQDLATGERRTVACDVVVLTGDWIPDHELARLGGLDLDRGTRGPRVDTVLRTSRPGVFAAGNLLHAVDTADVAALDGRHVAGAVRDWLADPSPALAPGVPIEVADPLRWVAPSLVRPGDPAPARGRLLVWGKEFRAAPLRLRATQDGRDVGRCALAWPLSPGRVLHVPWSMLTGLDPHGGPVVLGLR